MRRKFKVNPQKHQITNASLHILHPLGKQFRTSNWFACFRNLSAWRPRYAPQLSCKTSSSYTPVKHTPLNIFTFSIYYSLIQRTLPYSLILWAVHACDWQLALLQREQHSPTTSAGVSPRTTTQATTRAQCTSASFALSASIPFALLAITLCARRDGIAPQKNCDSQYT